MTVVACAFALSAVHAQTSAGKSAPGEERATGVAPTPHAQQVRATMAYRDVQQAAFESKLAEQDVLNTQEAYNITRARADALKIELEKAIKARDAAKAREAAARKRYDEVLQQAPR
ncbi:MAG: hypothetical protein FJY56_16380 [Betaproteobacteria bacterium]|nr:hypothetical protein [Betaproteobacteria bacterium]